MKGTVSIWDTAWVVYSRIWGNNFELSKWEVVATIELIAATTTHLNKSNGWTLQHIPEFTTHSITKMLKVPLHILMESPWLYGLIMSGLV